MKITLNTEFNLFMKNDQAFCDSLQVADTFHKRHDNVLRDIQDLDCSKEFNLLNFEETYYKDDVGRKQPRFLMTKDGFIFLVMGYRGKRAAAYKEEYIRRFNRMETFISSLQTTRQELPDLLDAVQGAHEDPRPYHYSNELNMLYRIVLGMSARKYRQLNGVGNRESIRPFLEREQLDALVHLQRVDIGLLVAGLSYEQRKAILSAKYSRTQALAS